VLLWGPYLWTDGMKGRAGDSMKWRKEDTRADGTHPSPSGQQKVAELLLTFFKSDGTSKGWFAK
jgi:lysophospholipase L1-like esterase